MIALKLLAGIVLLILGAELLVKGASKVAAALGITPLVIGLTVVAFGTSAPELVVSVMASLDGSADIALGNVVGSNIFNVLFILGISSVIIPLVVAHQLIRLDVPIMIGASLLLMLFCWDETIQKWEGAVLLAIGIAYTVFLIRLSRRENKQEESKATAKKEEQKTAVLAKDGTLASLGFIVVGLACLIFGSRWLVDSAVAIAAQLGVSQLVIGLTIIAAGTSLPEVATSVIASLRGQRDIAVGNVVGSNIFNILFILGIATLSSRGGIEVAKSALHFDLPVMIAVALACLPIFFTGRRLDRWEGFLFLGYYVAYTVFIILASKRSSSLEVFSNTMMWFVIPLTIITLSVVTAREIRLKR